MALRAIYETFVPLMGKSLAQPQLSKDANLVPSAVQPHHPSLTSSTTRRASRGRLSPASHSPGPHSGVELNRIWGDVTVENPDQKPKGKQLQSKPAEGQRVASAPPAHQRPGPGEAFVSWEHLASESQSEGCPNPSPAVAHYTRFPRPGALVPLAHGPVPALGWVLGKVLRRTRQSSERNREMLLPPKIHAPITRAHCSSARIEMVAIRIFFSPFQIAKVKYTIFRIHVYSCASASSL